MGLLDGLDDELAKHDMHMSVSRLSDEELTRGDFIPKVLREYLADGMIVNYTHDIPAAMLEMIRAHHTPAVWLNAKLLEDCVYPNDYEAARSATQELLKLGHRRVALLHMIPRQYFTGTFEANWSRMHYSVVDRQAGYADAVIAAGLSPRVTDHRQYVEEVGHAAACRALLSGPDRPTAVLVYSEHDLSTLMCVAAELGLSVPGDFSVLVFAPSEPWIAGRRVSAVRVPTAEMGRRAVNMLLRKIESPDGVCTPEAVSYSAVFGETVAPPPPV